MRLPPGIPELPPAPLAAKWRFCAFSGALLVGMTATVTPEAATWFGVRGPHCPLGTCLGALACPGCGLLRSTAAALQGELGLAVATHPAGLATALLVIGGICLNLDIVRRAHEGCAHRRLRNLGHCAFVAALLFGWVARLCHC